MIYITRFIKIELMEIDTKKNLSVFDSNRRFGVEIEINSFDLLSKPLNDKLLPNGIDYVACAISDSIKDHVVITKWQNDHYNIHWGLKPDSSCGIEIVSPVLKGIYGIEQVCQVVDTIKYNNFSADKRCSVHVHVDISNLNDYKLLSILTWWIKCEPVFFDSVLSCRKINSYCMMIGLNKAFKIDSKFYTLSEMMNIFGKIKYYSLNTYHKNNNKRDTIEFRIMDYDACKNSYDIRNWIKLILHFCECCIKKGMPEKFVENDYMTGYYWLDPINVIDFLDMKDDLYLSDEMKDVKTWFLKRCMKNSAYQNSYHFITSEKNFQSSETRYHAYKEIKSMI